MKENQSVKQRPLMYISQPNFQPAFVNMQQSIMVKNEPIISKAEQQKVETVEIVEKPLQEAKAEEKNPKRTTQTRRKFPELTVAEKVDFFINLPVNVPKATCEITTESESYRGRIISHLEGIVTVRTLKDPFKVELSIKDIKGINIISL
ncbi:CotO family spore coat protein [Bacillus sp. DJP31]|uniref:CotO family spore coat protein n=1 Tax=Bacillus sp. DJP31 TaxID=3409789 RepID=UPI003BB66CF4